MVAMNKIILLYLCQVSPSEEQQKHVRISDVPRHIQEVRQNYKKEFKSTNRPHFSLKVFPLRKLPHLMTRSIFTHS